MLTLKRFQKGVFSYLLEIWKGIIDSLDFFPIGLNYPLDRIIIPATLILVCINILFNWLLPLFLVYYWTIILLMYNELVNIVVTITRRNDKKSLKISKIITSRILLWILYIWIPSMDQVEEWLYFPIDLLLLSWSSSVWMFDLALTLENKDLSFRSSYFRDRCLYYIGYGFICGVSLYTESYGCLTLFHIISLYSNSVVNDSSDKPKYARWIPHQGNKIPTEFEEWLEYGINSTIEFLINKYKMKK